MRETERERARRLAWKRKHASNPRVEAWLVQHPPPEGWQGDRLDWAYTEGPVWLGCRWRA